MRWANSNIYSTPVHDVQDGELKKALRWIKRDPKRQFELTSLRTVLDDLTMRLQDMALRKRMRIGPDVPRGTPVYYAVANAVKQMRVQGM